MKDTGFHQPVTGSPPVVTQAGYSDCATLGSGYIMRDSIGGCLDAPDFIPLGSVLLLRAQKPSPTPSMGYRDGRKAAAALCIGCDSLE